ncbi:hypothetical protein SAMN05421542_4337 [Chryseobacterium jejuense]|uniref:Uncharacterized protein n=1 Tax=Chryseobacterium jejuense TaxID=445960 RepID=A0A2X2WWN4_CHRJE|nr:hypothetical protein SAMN05421542_4337 [Chryseobacterium jejuense]SQB42701.1 Uncharacterised protein [Chryseobacterium jejuense]
MNFMIYLGGLKPTSIELKTANLTKHLPWLSETPLRSKNINN